MTAPVRLVGAVGYYVHHVGRGHLHRAVAVAKELRRRNVDVTGLSTLSRPPGWLGSWLRLPPDDGAARVVDPSARGALHWAPRGDAGVRDRMAAIAAWLTRAAPAVLVSDLSVEVTALTRLHGVPVITTVLPGRRQDAAHQLGFQLADLIIAPWPDLQPTMCLGLEPYRDRVRYLGGLSRFDGHTVTTPVNSETCRQPTVLILSGTGGEPGDRPDWPSEQTAVPGWRVIHRGPGCWTGDVWPDLCAADVVVTQAGLGAIADIAAARKPAVVVPGLRPHDEQTFTAAALEGSGLALVAGREPRGWMQLLSPALAADGARWSMWSSGRAAAQFADAVLEVAQRPVSC